MKYPKSQTFTKVFELMANIFDVKTILKMYTIVVGVLYIFA